MLLALKFDLIAIWIFSFSILPSGAFKFSTFIKFATSFALRAFLSSLNLSSKIFTAGSKKPFVLTFETPLMRSKNGFATSSISCMSLVSLPSSLVIKRLNTAEERPFSFSIS